MVYPLVYCGHNWGFASVENHKTKISFLVIIGGIKVKRILILGSGGMLGHLVTLFFKDRKKDYSTANLSYPRQTFSDSRVMNVREVDRLKSFLETEKFDYVINCVALLVKDSELNQADAIWINSYFPHWLEEICTTIGTKVIHVSTFGIFDGCNGPFAEHSSPVNPLFYAKTKMLGELSSRDSLTVRSDFFGPDMNVKGKGLFNWFFMSKGDIHGYVNAGFSGVSSLEFAKFCDAAMKNGWSGCYNLAAPEFSSKFQLLSQIKATFGIDKVRIVPDNRPCNSFCCLSERKDINYISADYKTMLNELKCFMSEHRTFYEHYYFM